MKIQSLLLALACLAGPANAASFSITPNAVSNTYTGQITLQVAGLSAGGTVVVQKFLDLNTNGVINASDWMVQQFNMTDGQAGMVIGGVTNFNVPGDTDGTANGQITARMNFNNGDFGQNIAGKYLFKVSGNFTPPLTNSFTVTNFPWAQKFTGNVVSNATSTVVSNAVVLLFPPGANGSPVAGAVANNAGSYIIPAPPGTYSLAAFRSNYLANFATLPVLTLGSGATVTTNLTVTSATASISGKVVDAANSSIGLPGDLVSAQSKATGVMGIGFTDTNGNFTVGVQSGQWGVKADDTSLIVHGYLGLQNKTNVNAGATGINIAVPKATSLVYGSVKDNLGNPLTALDVYANDQNNNQYQTDGYTDANGNYVLGLLGNDSWWMEANGNNQITNYVFSQSQLPNNGSIASGAAVLQNFTAILATNYITGNVKFNGTNIVGVGVNANATINGTNYQPYVHTDSDGSYSLNAANGSWSVSLYTSGAYGDCLDSILGIGTYEWPNTQTAVINNNNATNNFIIQPCNGVQIITPSPLPVGEVGVYYDQFIGGSTCNGNYNWSQTGGTLPDNLNLYPQVGSYELEGTPDNSGTFSFTVQLTDGNRSTNKQYSLTISNAVQITTTSLPDGTNGLNYTQQLMAVAGVPFGEASPYSWTIASNSDGLPANLTLATNGLLSGTLADSGTFNFTVEVADSLGGFYDQPLSLTIASPPDVRGYYVTKLEAFQQLDATNIVLNTNAGPFNAFVGIVQSSLGSVPIANVTLPTGTVKGLPWGSSAIEIRNQESFTSQASFDAAYPPGNYDFAIYGLHDGLNYPVLSMPAPVYPDPPHVRHFGAAQSLNPLAAFALQWDAIPGGTANDNLWVVIADANGNPVFSTPYPPMDPADSLKGTDTSVVIPTNTFQLGQAYMGAITFFRSTSVNTTGYPGAVGVTVVAVQTWFRLAVASGSPVLDQPAKLSGTQFSFQLSGSAGQNYTVQYSTTLTNWNTLCVTNAPANSFLLIDLTATNAQRFYRVLVGP